VEASEFDKKYDDGDNIIAELDVTHNRRPGEETRRIKVDFHGWWHLWTGKRGD
jgi:hypothetical protein